MLHNMRYNLAGTSYKTSASPVGDNSGCPDTGCIGYELEQDLDFDGDDDGSTWSGDAENGFTLDMGDSMADYFPVASGGWLPIGDETNPFVAVFDGKDHMISNLAIRRDQPYIGLFGVIGEGTAIRNLGLVDNLADYTGSSTRDIFIGGLVGLSYGSITASHATGDADGGDGDFDYVGGLVGQQDEGGSITASYATGAVAGGAGRDNVGGLVGLQDSSSITASYATGDADGGDGDSDFVGGLVGWFINGSITASYATGDADGGDGNDDNVGGLVGLQDGGSITASYATGDADGRDGNDDNVGGLVGLQDGGSITASYATGDTNGGDGDNDRVGKLVSWQEDGSITESYGFGRRKIGELKWSGGDGSQKPVKKAAQLTVTNAESTWNNADNNTLGAWNFGTNEQIPALNYADYDGPGTVFDCSQFPANACTPTLTLLPGQDETEASGPSADFHGEAVTLAGSLLFDRVTIESWSWQQLEGPVVTLSGAAASETTFIAPDASTLLVFELTATDSEGRQYTELISLTVFNKLADRDGDGLIEIDSLLMLHNMRHNRKGTSYKTSAASVGNKFGCPATGCHGYELTENLDFDGDGDGTWSRNDEGNYTLDVDDRNDDYFPVDEDGTGGWLPIGDEANPFVAVFDGNTHTISNLAIRRNQTYIGLFGAIENDAVIRNLGLVDNLADYTGSNNRDIFIGGLVGRQDSGSSITASYATGDADGGDGDDDYVGGLVGRQEGGSITASYATGDADGGDGNRDYVGGLVGLSRESITASYATGDADGGDGNEDYVGGLVGYQWLGLITASYATGDADGGDGDSDTVGGLMGWQGGGSITASYATGDADGGDGHDRVGGLMGHQYDGSITASYATGDADGGDGHDRVGGLVGYHDGSITASYATGDADGGAGNDRVGGLVGHHDGSITASYATGDADGGDGDNDRVGGLVGQSQGSITASYGFGGTIGEESVGSDGSEKPDGVETAAQLTADPTNAGPAWNSADNNTLGAWDFGTDEQIPALNYADYDGPGTVFDCSQFPSPCDTLLPRQAKVNATGPSAVLFGATTTITGSLSFGRVTIDTWSWQQLEGPEGKLSDAAASETIFTAPDASTLDASALLVFELTATDSEGRQYTERISLAVVDRVVDPDGNGLIEIDSLLMLHNMRHNLRGTSYKTSPDSVDNSLGCPAARCRGYELTENLDFDVDDDGTWLKNNEGSYTLDVDDHNDDYFPVDGDGTGGWLPIGDGTNPFVAVFDGNIHTISNLAILRDQTYIGLFGAIGNDAVIRNLGLVENLADYTGSSDDPIYIGGLVGWQDSGSSITASHATGDAHGGDGDDDRVGGLVGQSQGSITASYATGDADGGDGDDDYVGGLVGQSQGSITASYATGDADGGDGDDDYVGGLVGESRGSITASYATGDADGGSGDLDYAGGLVGYQLRGSITASYATGDADGGDGDDDFVGGLVGYQLFGSITASYATGDADGGVGDDDTVGGLVGFQVGGSITASYATGDADGGAGNDHVGGLVGYQHSLFGPSITASYATGDAEGGAGNNDHVGGLVGFQLGGSITASYATGDADGGIGNNDAVGRLVGQSQGSITASYGFGGTIGEESVGSDGSEKPTEVETAAQLTADPTNAGSAWNSAESNTLGAWDFGTGVQIPALNYADYDGPDDDVFDCSQFPANACTPTLTLLPGQADVSASGPLAALYGDTVSLAGSLSFGRVTIESWSWRQLEGLEVTLINDTASETTFTAPATSTLLVFELTATDSEGRQYTESISLAVVDRVVDLDGNGLIDIDSLLMLHNMRHNLRGTSYKTSPNSVDNSFGCPAARCRGYELTENLDFDVDDDGTWSRNAEGGFTLDSLDSQADYFPVDDDGTGGWLPIGDEANPFAAVFDGNTHTISNLAILRDQTYIGLFGAIGNDAVIRNLGLVDNLADYTGSSDDLIYIGGLVGWQDIGSSITASYATGDADGGDGDGDFVGGLVGYQWFDGEWRGWRL